MKVFFFIFINKFLNKTYKLTGSYYTGLGTYLKNNLPPKTICELYDFAIHLRLTLPYIFLVCFLATVNQYKGSKSIKLQNKYCNERKSFNFKPPQIKGYYVFADHSIPMLI